MMVVKEGTCNQFDAIALTIIFGASLMMFLFNHTIPIIVENEGHNQISTVHC